MSASDEVAGLPGGEALAALAAQVHGNPAAIRDIANRWSAAAGDCATHAGNVQAAVADVGHEWQGSSASAFAAFMGRFGAAGRGAEQALDAAARELRGVAGALEEAHVSVESICENLLGEVSQFRAANPQASSAELNVQISGLTAEAAAAARPEVAQVQQALGRAQAALAGDLSRLNRTFSALPQAGAPGFLPSWATPGGWGPVPHQSPGNLSGTGSRGGAPHSPGAGGTAGSSASGAPGSSASGAPAGSSASGTPGSPDSGAGSSGSGTPAGSTAPAGTPVAAGAGRTPSSGSLDGRPVSGGSAQTVGAVLMGAPSAPSGPAPPQRLTGWIGQATKILEAQGIPASKLSPQDIWIIIQHESGGSPSAINNWDSNAAAGTPSIGLMQTIGPTFNAYALPGHGDIYNPVDNIIAGVRYALARYGSLDNVPGVAAVHDGQPYVGY